MLDRFADGVWTVSQPLRFWGVETGTRMTVVRLSGGGLLVHCPVSLDAATRREIDALGRVQAVVAASLYHHMFVGQWMETYPKASFWACPGLERKRSDLAFSGVLGDTPHRAWAADLDQAALTARFEHEIVFFHQPTRTLVCADALLNLRHHPSRLTRAAALLMGNTAPGKGYLEYIAVRDRALCRRQVDRILEWNIDGVVLAHGSVLPHGGREAVRRAYAWV